LYDVLVHHFPNAQVFKDVDNIDAGEHFVERITTAVESCDVLLTVIGPNWLTITDENGQRRLHDPEDYVRVDIETALERKIRVIPILVDNARMPGADELPFTLEPLVRRKPVEINPVTFDTGRLIAIVRKTLEVYKAHGSPRPGRLRRRSAELVRRQQEELARSQEELDTNYAQAPAAADARDWEQAADRYSMVTEAPPDYQGTNDWLAKGRRQHQVATLQAEAERLHRAGQWAAVIKVGEQLQAIDPAAADPDGLMTSARAELAAQQRGAALAADYDSGVHLFDPAGGRRQ
jgi:hypothetical protein